MSYDVDGLWRDDRCLLTLAELTFHHRHRHRHRRCRHRRRRRHPCHIICSAPIIKRP